MACVLSMTALYQSQYSDNVTDIRNTGFHYLDLNWINTHCKHSCFQNNRFYCAQCQIVNPTDSTELLQYQLKIGKGISGNVIKGSLHKEISDKQNLANGETDRIGKSESSISSDISKFREKRKALIDDCDEVYIPSKRVSPYLNTPKERKDERRKILKLSMKKIKELDNPETFLRRSVLVNNLTKRLQTELRDGKHISRKIGSYKEKCFSDYKALNNNCLSDIYLCEDPFLSDIPEAITDDMTETLINNVLNDNKSNET